MPKRGDIWWVSVPDSDGREQAGRRPAVVVSDNVSGLIVTVPFTTSPKSSSFAYTFLVEPTKGNGLPERSIALLFHIRATDIRRFDKYAGRLEIAMFRKLKIELKKMFKL